MHDMKDIEQRAKLLSEARAKVRETVDTLQQAMNALARKNMPVLRRQMHRVTQLQAELEAVVELAPGLFIKPKTVVLHGLRIGFEKGKGKLSWEDEDQVVALIRKKLPDQADVLIKAEYHPIKKALANLTVQQLRAIGCQVDEAGDRVIVRAVDSALEKLVEALLKGAKDQAQAQAEAEAAEAVD